MTYHKNFFKGRLTHKKKLISAVPVILLIAPLANSILEGHAEQLCPVPNQLTELISCVLKFHPRSQRAELEVDQARLLTDVADQGPNFDLDSETLGGGA